MRTTSLLSILIIGLTFYACDSGGGSGGGEPDAVQDTAAQDTPEVVCEEVCADRECGSLDGCDCGACADEEVCSAQGICQPADVDCDAACADLECGEADGCDCGGCDGDLVCKAGVCGPCEPVCAGLWCGDDGCGGSCGSCDPGTFCSSGACETDCDAVCAGKECGNGGDPDCDCGACAAGFDCVTGACVPCQPDCGVNVCGPDGCGGTCGDCADGAWCNEGACVQGECWDWIDYGTGVVHKINSIEFGPSGTPGSALDVDENPATCAPEGDCQDGLDNNLGAALIGLEGVVNVNAEMVAGLESGAIILLAESMAPALDGTTFTIRMYAGEEVEPDPLVCNWQTDVCDYLIEPEAINTETCDVVVEFDNATIIEGHLSAGGPDAVFALSIPLLEGAMLTMTARRARVEATTVVEDSKITALADGVIGGAINKVEVQEACQALPDDLFVQLGLGKDMVCPMLDLLLVADIDTDEDPSLDSVSVGIKFAAIQGNITGMNLD
ncbi:MAG: hypothetical protein ABIK09_08325 [Pseudomonadota bacterium]